MNFITTYNKNIGHKTIIILLLLLFFSNGFAQNGINYKAIIKDTNGNVLASSPVSIQFVIYEGAALTNNVYQETHTINTDANGLLIVNIGEGTTTDSFENINWVNDEHFLNIQIDKGEGLIDLGTTAFKTVPYAKVAENVSGLERINEGNEGWRLTGRDPIFYGDIGDAAVDLSTSFNSNMSTFGATGDYSFATGLNSSSSGNFSIATGQSTQASGGTSTAMGINTIASGAVSTAMGSSTLAEASMSTAMGRYNIGGGDSNSWVDTDPLLEIGNGTSNSNRRNALTVYKSGLHYINSTATGLRIDPEDSGIVINNSGGVGLAINTPQNNGIYVYSAANDGIQTIAQNYGGNFRGDVAGVYASGEESENDVPDVILGSNNSVYFNSDGIISTNPERNSSDMFLRSYDAVVVQLDYDNDETGNFRVRNGNGTTVFDVNESGDLDINGILRIGTETIEDTGSNQLSINASLLPDQDNVMRLGNSSNRWVGVWAVDGTINTSDRREKKNIKSLSYGLDEVLKMQPVSYQWKNRQDQDTKLGLIAQDVLKLVPEVVKTHEWQMVSDDAKAPLEKVQLDRLGVYYSDLIPVLIKAIQEQQEIISSQQQQNNLQKAELTELQKGYQMLLSRIETLESSTSN